MKKLLIKVKHLWWKLQDRVERRLQVGDFAPQETPFWYVDEQTWSFIVRNVRSKGYSYYSAEIDLWLSTAIKEVSQEPEEVREDWMILDIIDAYRIKAAIKMIASGINIPALEFINDELDTNVRDMAINILLK
jgi:hypothetical protein